MRISSQEMTLLVYLFYVIKIRKINNLEISQKKNCDVHETIINFFLSNMELLK